MNNHEHQRPLQYCYLNNLDFSLLIVTAKPGFGKWVQAFKARKLGPEHQDYRVYFAEQDTVWLIPKIDRFSEPGSFESFLDDVKPKILLREISNYGARSGRFWTSHYEGEL